MSATRALPCALLISPLLILVVVNGAPSDQRHQSNRSRVSERRVAFASRISVVKRLKAEWEILEHFACDLVEHHPNSTVSCSTDRNEAGQKVVSGRAETAAQQPVKGGTATTGPPNVVCMVPIRIGSTRLALKNLRYLAGRFMCEHALRAAALSGECDRVVLNADFDSVAPLAALVNEELRGQMGYAAFTAVEFYRRPVKLQGHFPADDVVADFMGHHPGQILMWVNPTSPLQSAAEVAAAARYLADQPSASVVIGVTEHSRHAVWNDNGSPLNFDPSVAGARTQELRPIAVANYCVLIWRYTTFLDSYRKVGAAYFAGLSACLLC